MTTTEPDPTTTLCTCGHHRGRHGVSGNACVSGGCGCVRFVAVPALPEGVVEVMNMFTDAQKQVKQAQADLVEAERHANTATVIVANRFLDLYNALPLAVRNKIRHLIVDTTNTAKDGQSYDDPKRADP